MYRDTQIPNRELALLATKLLSIADNCILGVAKTKQFAFMEIYL
jgi:hypothetical protein